MLPLTAVAAVHAFIDVTVLIDICTVLSAITMLGFILSDQIEQSLRQQRENAYLQTEIMLSQIQPHFLNNTLVAIGHLCNGVPEAKAALYKFTSYLQGNMDSLFEAKPIPFTTELEHTKAFLELEQLRLGRADNREAPFQEKESSLNLFGHNIKCCDQNLFENLEKREPLRHLLQTDSLLFAI